MKKNYDLSKRGVIVLLAILIFASIIACHSTEGLDRHLTPEEEQAVSVLKTIGFEFVNSDAALVDVPLTSVSKYSEDHNLSDFTDKLVLFRVWASWCSDCQREMPAVRDFANSYSNEKVALVPVAMPIPGKETQETAQKYWEKEGNTFPAYVDNSGLVMKHYRTGNVPSTYIIKNAKVLAVIKYGFDWNAPEFKQAIDVVADI